jgi:hydrogenase/urease accessory protein HupE
MKFLRILITAVLWAVASAFLLSAIIGGVIGAVGINIDFPYGGIEVFVVSFGICLILGWCVASRVHSKK